MNGPSTHHNLYYLQKTLSPLLAFSTNFLIFPCLELWTYLISRYLLSVKFLHDFWMRKALYVIVSHGIICKCSHHLTRADLMKLIAFLLQINLLFVFIPQLQSEFFLESYILLNIFLCIINNRVWKIPSLSMFH